MMPGIFENNFSDDINDDFNTPVVSLKEALPVRELLTKHETEFEVRPDEGGDEEKLGAMSPESCFDFAELEKVLNFDVIDVGTPEDGDDATPFEKYRRKMHDLRDDGKVKKYLVKQGIGGTVPEFCVVYVRYQAYVEYSEVPFDSTLWQCSGEGDLPVPINLAKGQLLPGLYEGICSMRKGEKAEFLVHPDLAYGQYGCPPRIPPDATVLFIVEVDRFVDCGDIHENNDDLDMYERKEFCNVIKVAKGHYMLGNDQFKRENYGAAVNKYRLVINMMHNARLANEQEEKERNRFLIKNYTNACVCYKKLKNYKRICTMGADAIRVDEKEALQNFKLLYFWGYAKMMLNDFYGAKKHLLAAQKLHPQDKDIASALKELEKKKNDALQQEKIMMRRAFGNTSSEVTITEVDEAEEGFRKAVRAELEQFASDHNRDSLTIRDQQFTSEEEKIYLQVAKDLGLYARVIDGEKRIIHIKKPSDY